MLLDVQKKIDEWLQEEYDQETRKQINILLKDDPKELSEAFSGNLEFGTGGVRSLMGVGPNRMNQYTVGMITQGFANYLLKVYPREPIKVAIAYDSRNNSRFFATITATVFSSNNIHVYLFDTLRPTPELSFAIRYLSCHAGVVCTASHNPKEYNGYKAYWNDGAQLVPPHDKNVMDEVHKIKNIQSVRWQRNQSLITTIGEKIDDAYLKMVQGLSIYPDVIKKQANLKIVYTPIHGTGIQLVPAALKLMGFTAVHIVEEQAKPDGNFPTVTYPNPEEKLAMQLGLQLAEKINADILLGTDPDSDRVGIGVKNNHNEWVLLNGNQTAVLAFAYILEARKEKKINKHNDMVITTIVTTDMINVLATANQVHAYQVLTGFKWIAEQIRLKDSKEQFVIGGEESFGMLIGDQVRDKDAISATALLCEMASYQKNKGKTLFDKLIALYIELGYYLEDLHSLTLKGADGQKRITELMEQYRSKPPVYINKSQVIQILDYQSLRKIDTVAGTQTNIDLPKSNVLQWILADGSKISVRPSGTEPKIKFYFSVKTSLSSADQFDDTTKILQQRINDIIDDLNIRSL